MRFWDSSAIVPLCVPQPARERSLSLYDADAEMVVWWGTRIECVSALTRLQREGVIEKGVDGPWRILQDLEKAWVEIAPGIELRTAAERLLRLHPLRAADALQLAAALEWAGTAPAAEFVSYDDRLADAAQLQGFVVRTADASERENRT